MTTDSLKFSFLQAEYLNGRTEAVFEALNLCLNYRPYGINDDSKEVVDEIPIWLLQALREAVVFQIENDTPNKTGPKKTYELRYEAYMAKERAKSLKIEGKSDLLVDDLAKEILSQNGINLASGTVKKYASDFVNEDLNLGNVGKYSFLSNEDQKIFEAIVRGMN
jgi:hypothetical protein